MLEAGNLVAPPFGEDPKFIDIRPAAYWSRTDEFEDHREDAPCRSPELPRDRSRSQRVVHRHGLHRHRRHTLRAVPPCGQQRPLQPRRPHRLAHPPQRPDHLRHRGRRALPAPRRRDRGHPPRRPRVLRARRGPLARRSPQPLHDPPRDATSRREGQPRRVGRARKRRGVRQGAVHRPVTKRPFGDVRVM